jgi:hypothetical protein
MPLLDVPAYRQNQAPLVVVVATAAGRPGHFVATLNGTALITASKTPMCAAGRGLLAEGFDPDAIVVLKHAYSPTVCLTAKLGVAARLAVKDCHRGKPTFEPWQSMPPSSPVASPVSENGQARAHGRRAPGRPPDDIVEAIARGVVIRSRIFTRPKAITSDTDRSGPRRAAHYPRTSSR